MGVEDIPRTIAWVQDEAGARVRMVDQRELPERLAFVEARTVESLVDAIGTLAVRGAPALAIAGAYGSCLAALNALSSRPCAEASALRAAVEDDLRRLATARPTAVNLRWGVEQVVRALDGAAAEGAAAQEAVAAMVAAAQELEASDEAANRAIGQAGAALLPEGARVITHCNAGSLATGFYGTALGVVYAAFEQGKLERVYADETRPVGQGVRLTMWELMRAGVPCTVQCDNMAASLMAEGRVDAVIVGADRIARNGDVANKIGTYSLAIAAAYHGVPFYVAAPVSTVDVSLGTGAGIPIEHRSAKEVVDVDGFCPDVRNPAFDVTPASLVTAIVTEHGVVAPSEVESLMARLNSN